MALGMEYGKTIYEARSERDMTQAAVAERAGVSTRWYQRVEKGDVKIGFETAIHIASVLGIDLNAFLEEQTRRAENDKKDGETDH